VSDPQPRLIYRKHNSFVELRAQHSERAIGTSARIAAIRGQPELSQAFSAAHLEILNQALSDLLDPGNDDEHRFTLTPHVIDEIDTLADSELPRYLVHRYRYEVFPQKRIIDGYPPYLQIEPSSICNFRCVFCFETDTTFTDKSSGFMGRMTLDLFKQVVDAAHHHVEFISLASRGEPLACPDIVPMLEYVRGKFLNLKLNTNASLLDEKKAHAILAGGVKTVVFSVDAAKEPLYSQLRVNGKLDVVLKNIERFHQIRETQYRENRVITRVSGVKFNDDQDLDEMQTLWGGLVDQVAFVKYNPWENVYQQATHDLTSPCSDLWRRMFVWWADKVNPCDVDYKSTLAVGRFPESDLSTLWGSTHYQRFREAHVNDARSTIAPCNRCTVV
jgi:organic radical activating enzyme